MTDADIGSGSGEHWPHPAVAWYAVAVLTLANVVALVDRQILTLLVEPVRADLGISDTGISLLHGFAFALFYSVMALPLARLADAKSRRAIITVGIAAWSVMTAACGLAKTFTHLFLARVGVGIGEAALVPAANSLIGDSFPAFRRALPLGVFAAGISAGMGLGLLAGAAVVKATIDMGAISVPIFGVLKPWQMVFVLVGLAGLPVALLMATLKEPARHDERNGAPSGTVTVSEALSFAVRHWRTYATLFGGYTSLVAAANGIAAWTPTFYIRSYGLTASEAGVRMGAVILAGGLIGAVTGGALADWLTKRGVEAAKLKVLVACAAAMLVPAALGSLMPTVNGALFFLFWTFFLGAMTVAPTISALQDLTPNRLRAQATAVLYFLVNLIGVGLGPFAVALVTDYGFGDDTSLRSALSMVATAATALGVVLLAHTFRPYRKSMDLALSD